MKTRTTLRRRLQVQFALVALVPLMVVGALAAFWFLPHVREDISAQHRERALAISLQVTALLGDAERELGSLAEYLFLSTAEPAPGPTRLLDSRVGGPHIFSAIYLTDKSDVVINLGLPEDSMARRGDFLGTDLSRRKFMIERHAEGHPAWSDTFLSIVRRKLAVAYVIPLVSGTLTGVISIDRLTRFVSDLPTGSHLTTILLDGRSQVIAHSEGSLTGQNLNLKYVSGLMGITAGGPDVHRFMIEDRTYIGNVVEIKRMGWKVLVAHPLEDAQKPWRMALWLIGAGLLLALILAGAAGWLMARGFSRDFSRFTSQARSMAHGDFDRPWPSSRVREFANLAENLQLMAQAIRRREDDLATSEARYRSVVSNAPVVLIQFDTQGVITLFEGKSLSKLGLNPGRALGRSVLELFADSPKIAENARQAMKGQASQFTAGIGSNEFEIYLSPVYEDGASPYVLGILVDVTQRRRAEKALEANERLLRESQKVARLGHYTLDLHSGEWESSPILDEILGIGPGFVKNREGLLSLFHPDDRDDVAADMLKNTIKDGKPYDREFRIIRVSDQQERWVHSQGKVVHDVQGIPAKIIGTIRDITDRKRLEQQLIQSQKMEAVGQLAGGIAHDFNNMLSVILGYAELMKLSLPPESPYFPQLTQIERAAIHSRDITRQLLAFSRKQIISPRPQDLNALFEGSIKTLASLIGEDIALRFKPGDGLWQVKVDPSQIDQILMNLAVNARDAMPEGGTLLIETANVIFDQDYCRRHVYCKPGHFVMLAISDVGIGMDKETTSHIFEPFFTTKEVGAGTGLGLATVYGIIKQNEGFINVYSEPGRGTTFRIYLPRTMGEDEPSEIREAAKPDAGTGTVLLVEDDEMVRQTTGSMLEELGYTVVTPQTPSEAVSMCLKGDLIFDLLVSDVVMPEMSGKDLRDRVKALQPGIGVLFISGYTNNVIVHHGVLEAGVHFLAKPFTLGDLAAKVREAMS